MAEPFFFDDFFVSPEDPGVTYQVPIRGRLVPIVCRRGISLKDKEEASAAAIKRHIDDEGRLVIDGVDEFRLDVELLSRTIKSWPFVYRNGSPVPITAETIAAFLSEGADRLVQLLAKGLEAKEAEATGPFDNSSGAASPTLAEEPENASNLAASPSESPVTTTSTGDPSR